MHQELGLDGRELKRDENGFIKKVLFTIDLFKWCTKTEGGFVASLFLILASLESTLKNQYKEIIRVHSLLRETPWIIWKVYKIRSKGIRRR